MRSIWRIITYSKSLWRYYVAISLLTILLSIVYLLIPMLSGWAIDEMSNGTGTNIRYMVWLAIGIMIIELISTIGNNINGYLGDMLSIKLNKLLSYKYYEHLLELPQNYFDTEQTGKIVNRLNRSITQITNFMQMLSNNFLQFIFSTVFSLIIVAYYSWTIAILLGMLYPIYIFLTLKTSSVWQDYQRKKNINNDIAIGRFAEAIGQIKLVKSYIQEKRELKHLDHRLQKAVNLNEPQSRYWHKRDVQRRVILNIIFFLVYLFIFIQGARGEFSAGQAVALILYAMQIRIPLFTISFLVDNTQKAIADSKDYFDVMSLDTQVDDNENSQELRIQKGAIRFNNVSFKYASKPVLQKLDFDIEPGTKVALVGESGEGKTTITNLLIRLYDPQTGSITIDNQPIININKRSLRSNIGIVFQEPSLFSGTIAENIAYSKPSASKVQIINAAKAANAHNFITSFDKGYQTEIGERGLKLSGGQKQRIAIARAILKDAPILILDEATSSLDSRSEVEVQGALKRLMNGRTTIIIAHRLSTIAHVDKIITLKNGRVDEAGAPRELALTNGIYSQLLAITNENDESAKKQLKSFDIDA